MSSDSDDSGSQATELILGAVVEEFSQRLRDGETPDTEEFVARHPELGQRIRELLETVGSLEVAADSGASTGSAKLTISRIGDYRLERELGRGGMGIVFLAWDEKLERRVALKLLPLQATLDPRFLERFRREARAAALLQHPHIVPVYGVGEEGGLHYYAMRYIEGQPLDEIVRAVRELESQKSSAADSAPATGLAAQLSTREWSGSDASSDFTSRATPAPKVATSNELSPIVKRRSIYNRNVARLGVQVADALAYAHSRGILHRDIKPANLILDAEGCIWVTDFGLCKTVGADDLTMSSDLVGTLRYMAPEQIEGRSDIRSDVYELGITLYELFTLQRPFPFTDRAALLRAIAESSSPRPRKVRPDLPSDLEAIVLKATAKLPAERYGTADALAEDLRAFLSGRPIAARPPSAFRLLRLVVRRNRVLTGTVAAFLLVLVVATTLYLQSIAFARAEQAQQLYVATISAAEATLDQNPGLARSHLLRSPEELRNWEWKHLWARLDDSLSTFAQMEYGVRAIDIDRTSGRLVFTDLVNTLHVRDLGPEAGSWSVSGAGIGHVKIAPGGASAVTAGTHHAQAWSLDGAPTLLTTLPTEAATFALSYDSSGERVFLGLNNGTVHCYNAALTAELFVITGYPNWIYSLVLTSNDRFLIVGCADGIMRITDLETREFRDIQAHMGGINDVDVTGDGEIIASGGRDGSVNLWSFASGALIDAWRIHDNAVMRVLFSPTDDMLVSTSRDRTIGVFDMNARSRLSANAKRVSRPESRILRGHANQIWDAAFLSSGNLLTPDEDGVLKEWDPRVAGGTIMLEGHVADVWGLSFSPDSRSLLSWNRDQSLRLWDVETGNVLRVFLEVQSSPGAAAISPAGDTVAASYADGGVRVWDSDRAEVLQELFARHEEGQRPERMAQVKYSSDAERLFASDRKRLTVWEIQGNEYQFAFDEDIPGVYAIAASPNGNWVAAGTTTGEVLLFEAHPWRLVERRTLHAREVHYMTFDPSSLRLFSAGNEGVVAVWNVEESAPVREILIEPKELPRGSNNLGVAIGPEGKRLLVSTEASGPSMWNLERGEKVLALNAGPSSFGASALSPNGERVAAGTTDGFIRIWDTMVVDDRRASYLRSTSREVEARQLVDDLFAEHANYDLVKRALHDDDTLDDELREQALRKAHKDSGSLDGILHRARRLLRSPEGKQGAYKRPMIHDLDPRVTRVDAEAFFRQGDHDRARSHLEPILDAGEKSGTVDVEACVLLAMIYAKLDRPLDAEEMLASVRELVSKDDVALVALLQEAEELLQSSAE